MCGIAGRSARASIEPRAAEELSSAMQAALVNRGPDAGGMHHDDDTLLVHRRLAIVDLSDAGRQPLWNEDESVAVIVNGEIYNFRELRSELQSRGHRFRSRSDSEVLVHLYEEGGIDACCARASGMFAFALWDSRVRDLFLVRDRIGIKPLVLAEHDGGVSFASTIQGLLADAEVPRELRPEALASLLRWGFVPGPWSALRHARRLPRGSWVRIRAGHVVEQREWCVDEPGASTEDDSAVRAAIETAVRTHLVADVPVGVLLSAGIDSGLVTALAARTAGASAIEAWTVSHAGHREDEYPEAARIADWLGITLHEVPVGGRGLTLERFDGMVEAMDEPLADHSLVGLHALFEGIARDRRVVLSGDGGDELFGGYDWHVGMPAVPGWASRSWFRRAAPQLARFAPVAGPIGAAARVAKHVQRHPALVYLDKLRHVSEDELRELGVEPSDDEPIRATAIRAWECFASRGQLEQMLAVERATSLVDQMLAKVDTSAMAHSVEARVPLLADGVLPVARSLPAHRKREDDVGKVCLRDWYAELLPPELARRRKTGFNSPIDAWLGSPVGEELRMRAAEGMALLGLRKSPQSARAILAGAVIATWAARLKQGSLVTH